MTRAPEGLGAQRCVEAGKRVVNLVAACAAEKHTLVASLVQPDAVFGARPVPVDTTTVTRRLYICTNIVVTSMHAIAHLRRPGSSAISRRPSWRTPHRQNHRWLAADHRTRRHRRLQQHTGRHAAQRARARTKAGRSGQLGLRAAEGSRSRRDRVGAEEPRRPEPSEAIGSNVYRPIRRRQSLRVRADRAECSPPAHRRPAL